MMPEMHFNSFAQENHQIMKGGQLNEEYTRMKSARNPTQTIVFPAHTLPRMGSQYYAIVSKTVLFYMNPSKCYVM